MRLSLAFAVVSLSLLATPALAYTAKSEAQMKQECDAKWKATPEKIPFCLNGKKAYQARMLKAAAAAKAAPVAKKAEVK